MAVLTIGVTQVIPSTQAEYIDGKAASTIVAGEPCYKNSSGLYARAQADVTITEATVVGIATHGASANQPIRLQIKGRLILGATAGAVAGRVYILSATPGAWQEAGVAPLLVEGDFTVVLGVGVGSNAVDLLLYSNSLSVIPA